ncbi:hypothetical protein [Pandoraea sp. CB10b_02]|uniref:hypothetical protein n=1 Tax=Pandoraea sp. CB10b_02 TaxID=2014535 RepID=UPI00257A83C2|nr:hypothetical protein [Pandoraea sp. CB10b_02]
MLYKNTVLLHALLMFYRRLFDEEMMSAPMIIAALTGSDAMPAIRSPMMKIAATIAPAPRIQLAPFDTSRPIGNRINSDMSKSRSPMDAPRLFPSFHSFHAARNMTGTSNPRINSAHIIVTAGASPNVASRKLARANAARTPVTVSEKTNSVFQTDSLFVMGFF